MLEDLVRLLVPPRCPVCGSLAEAGQLCRRCLAAIEEPPGVELEADQLDSLRAAFPLEGRVHRMVSAIKHRGMLGLVELAAASLDDFVGASISGLEVVAVPPSRVRLATRGFDPAGLLGAELAARTGLRFDPTLARKDFRRQRGRDRQARLRVPPKIVARSGVAERILLVDDVVTTGATFTAAARALRGAGAEQVHGIAFAATPATH